MNKELLNDAEWLNSMYWDEGLFLDDVAELADCSEYILLKYMRKFNIPRRSKGEAIRLSYVRYPEIKRKASERAKLQCADPEYRSHLTKCMVEHWKNPEFRKRISKSSTKKVKEQWKDPKFRKAVSKAAKKQVEKQWKDPEFRKIVSEAAREHLTERWNDPEFRRKKSKLASEVLLKKWKDDKFRERMSGENSGTWKGGIQYEPYTEEFNEEFKESVRVLHNRKCFLCGRASKKRELDVHHIDYDKKNSVVSNCVPLCRKCHADTLYNREEWHILLEEEWSNFLNSLEMDMPE